MVTLFQKQQIILKAFLEGKSQRQIAKEFGINYKISHGSETFDLAKAVGGIKSIPTTFIIEKNGKIYQKIQGLAPYEMLETDIKKVLEK